LGKYFLPCSAHLGRRKITALDQKEKAMQGVSNKISFGAEIYQITTRYSSCIDVEADWQDIGFHESNFERPRFLWVVLRGHVPMDNLVSTLIELPNYSEETASMGHIWNSIPICLVYVAVAFG
jgi:hypothetical protein